MEVPAPNIPSLEFSQVAPMIAQVSLAVSWKYAYFLILIQLDSWPKAAGFKQSCGVRQLKLIWWYKLPEFNKYCGSQNTNMRIYITKAPISFLVFLLKSFVYDSTLLHDMYIYIYYEIWFSSIFNMFISFPLRSSTGFFKVWGVWPYNWEDCGYDLEKFAREW